MNPKGLDWQLWQGTHSGWIQRNQRPGRRNAFKGSRTDWAVFVLGCMTSAAADTQ